MTTTYCTFWLDDLYLGVEVIEVQEVLRHQVSTRVPLAHEVVRGLMNLRGEIVMTMDLRRRFGLDPRPEDVEPMHVVVRAEDGVVSLLVDRIADVVDVEDDTLEPPPPTLQGRARHLVSGVHKLPDRLLLVLDKGRLLDLANAARATVEV